MLLIHDQVMTDVGLTATNLVACFDSKYTVEHLGNDNFEVSAVARYRLTHNHASPVLKNHVFKISMNKVELLATGDIFELLYNRLAENYVNTERV